MKGKYVRIIHPVGTYPSVTPEVDDVLPTQTGLLLNEVRLGVKASSVNDVHKGWGIRIMTGVNNIQEYRNITAYNGSTKVATLDVPWANLPVDDGARYALAKPDNRAYLELFGAVAIFTAAEVQVLSDWSSVDYGTNFALGGTATYSSGPGKPGTYYDASRAIDGDVAATNFTQSNPATFGTVWWMVELTREVDIGIVRVVNRRDCCQNRILGFQIEVLDTSMKVVYSSNPISAVAHTYEVFPPNKDVFGTISPTGALGTYFTQYTPFGNCNATCGGGVKKRVRGIISDQNGLFATMSSKDLEDTQPCNLGKCIVSVPTVDYTEKIKLIFGATALIMIIICIVFYCCRGKKRRPRHGIPVPPQMMYYNQ